MDKRFSKLIKFGKAILPAEGKGNADVGAQTDKMLVAESGLFDDAFYTEQVGPISNDVAPIEHFLINGASNLASPSRAFDSAAYVEKYKDVQGKAINPLLHYLKHGAHEGRQKISVSALEGSDDQLKSEMGSLKKEEAALIANSSYFNEEFYGDAYADLLEDYTGTPSEHYVDVGVSKNLKPSLYFDPAYYLKAYSDVKKSGQSALLHYVKFGEMEGRQPNSSVSEIPRSVLKKWAETPEGLFPYIELLTKFKIAERAKNWSDAENNLREVLELENESAVIYNHLANMLRRQGKWWQEVEALKNAIELEGQHATWHYRLGEAQEVMSRFQQAAAAYANAIELKKGKADAEWYYRQGYCHERKGHDGPANLHRAKQAYQQAIDKDTKLDSKRFGIGVFHQKRGHWVQAAEAYARQLSTTPLDAELNYRLGMAYDRCYEWEKAEHYYTLALGLEIDKPDWHYRLGFVRERQKKYFEASEAYQYAALTRSRHTPYWFYRWGYVLEQAGEHQQACDAFLQTRQQPTLDAEAVSTPQALQNSGDDEQEIDIDTLPVALTPLEQYKQALLTEHQVARINNQLAEDCTSPALWYRLGNVYERQQQWQQAADAYQHALARKNDHTPEWYFRLGYVLFQDQDYSAACKAFLSSRVLQKAYGAPETPFNKSIGFREAATYTEYYESLPIEKNTILYESFHGVSMSCNPYALFLHVLQRNEFKGWKHIWVIDSYDKIPQSYRTYKDVFFVCRNSDVYMRYLATAEVLINNSTFPTYFIRKEYQKYLNTWHGTPWKTLGKDIKNNFMEYKNTQRNFLHATHLISPNPHTTWVLTERNDIDGIYSGKLAETGYPRIDLTLNATELDKKVLRELLGIGREEKVVLYAPTWRGTLGTPDVEVDKLLAEIEELKSLNCHFLFRGHYFVEAGIYEAELGGIVVADNINTNELLSIVDVLITDYSSISFDFMATGKPIVYYLDDYEEYSKQRGLYFDHEEMPGEKSFTLHELKEKVIGALSQDGGGLCHKDRKCKFTTYDDGQSSQRVIDWLLRDKALKSELSFESSKIPILIFAGDFLPNGITTSFVNLASNIDNERFDISLVFDPRAVSDKAERLEQFSRLPATIKNIPRTGRMNRTVEENWVVEKFNQQQDLQNEAMWETYCRAYEREFVRIFGFSKFDALIDFTGYGRFWPSVLGCAPSCFNNKKSIYQHNDKHGEWKVRFPNLKGVFSLYKKFDQFVSVSRQTRNLNEKNLVKSFQLESEKFVFCDNLQNPSEVELRAEGFISFEDSQLFKGSGTVFITLGRLSPEKDHEKLICAFSKLREKNPESKLIVLGEGVLENKLLRMIKEKGQQDNIYLLGQRFNPFPLLKRADCFVLSSNHEGQPMVLFEAMILNKPIIATDIVGSRSAIEGRSGHLVENSEEGLVQGMQEFINGELIFEEFALDDYQLQAIDMFYEKVCNVSS